MLSVFSLVSASPFSTCLKSTSPEQKVKCAGSQCWQLTGGLQAGAVVPKSPDPAAGVGQAILPLLPSEVPGA